MSNETQVSVPKWNPPPVPFPHFEGSAFCLMYSGEGAQAFVYPDWRSLLLARFEYEVGDENNVPDWWGEAIEKMLDEDSWTGDEWSKPYCFSEDIGEISQVQIIRLTALLGPAAAHPKPIAWAAFAENGNCRIWFGDRESAVRWNADHNEGRSKLVALTPTASIPGARWAMTREQLLERELADLDAAADTADLIASTSVDAKLRALLFSAEKNLRAAALLMSQAADKVAPVQ